LIREIIVRLVERENLSYEDSREVMKEIMSGDATSAQIAAFLTALRMKGETVEEISAFAETMRENCRRIHPRVTGRLVDTCGTGGDRVKTFNISTAAAFLIAGAGVAIAKHGNRSVTSHCGSADVLERFGLNLNMTPEAVECAIERIGIGFMYAPAFHPAMKYAVSPRKEIGIRTVFNVLGPLANPASANAQLLGVYDGKLVEPVAYVLRKLGCEEAMVVHGLNGLDEISTIGKTALAWLREGEVATLETVPSDFGVKQVTAEALGVSSPEESAETIFRIINGCCAPDEPRMNMVLVNSAAGIILGGEAEDFLHGMEVARKSVNSGAAYKKLKELILTSGGDSSKLEELESKYA
jgi:anthranilate phosphoribosyltransferase